MYRQDDGGWYWYCSFFDRDTTTAGTYMAYR
jgi:hypothetical protein